MDLINKTQFNFAFIVGKVNFPKNSLTLIVKGTYNLIPDKIVTLANEQLYPTGDEFYPEDEDMIGGPRYPSDFAYFKPRADILLVGKCFAPEGEKIYSGTVRFQAGAKSKSLNIFGNRYWTGSLSKTFSNPESFSEMELRYENSFGGKDYKKNPVGKGIDKAENKSGGKLIPLPNIMHYGETPSFTAKFEPAGFGPLGQMWIQRFSKLGSYKGNYVKERWPWFPKDFDWSYFNSAPADMQLDGYLKGDEKLYFENLHPTQSKYYSQLPGLRLRCFLNELDEKKEMQFKEVKMNLDTLWVDMELEKLVMIWRGVNDVKSEDYEEIQKLLIVSERLDDQPQSVEYYKIYIENELPEAEENVFAPAPFETDYSAEIEIEKELAITEELTKEALIKAGLSPDALIVPDEKKKKEEVELLKELGIENEEDESVITREIFIEQAKRLNNFEGKDLRGIDLSGLNLRGFNFQNAILTGIPFSNSDLSGVNFSGAELSKSDLSGAKLKEALIKDSDLNNAVLIKADLTGAIIEGSSFEKAKLNNAVLNDVKAKNSLFPGADLSNTILTRSDFTGADLSKAILDGADFSGSILAGASVEGASGIQANMSGAELGMLKASEGCNFTKAIFKKAHGVESIWEKAVLDETDFSFCEMEGANFSNASLEKVNLTGANMKFAKFIKANLKNANLKDANFFQGSFEKARLTDADCSRSNFYGVEFLDSETAGVKFLHANLKMTKLYSKS